MSEEYIPPKVWKWDAENGGKFGSLNRPIAGPLTDKALPTGKHPLQLYSMATPNGVKVTIMLEELLALGHSGAEYDAYLVNIMEGGQFDSGFVDVNPNSKIPAMVDQSTTPPRKLFETGSILLYLAEKFDVFLAADGPERTETLNWLFWQMGSAPYLGGGFGHFYAYAPKKFEYPINRFAMETKRQLDVLDRRLSDRIFIAGDKLTIADFAIWPWYGCLVLGELYSAAEFLDVGSYKHLMRWSKELSERPAFRKGKMVNRAWGEDAEQLHERHDASDFETKTQDKIS